MGLGIGKEGSWAALSHTHTPGQLELDTMTQKDPLPPRPSHVSALCLS